MELHTTSMRSNRYVNKSVSELQQANSNPIDGYQELPLMTLEETIEEIIPLIPRVMDYVTVAKQNCNRNSNLLTWDESAAIYLYTMPTSFFSCLNYAFRAENRHELKPWFAFLKLLMNGLEKLPSSAATLWRAVSSEVDSFPANGDMKIWWSINSFSTAIDVVQYYLGENGTLFVIEAIHGKNISEYSVFPEEQEVILMPGTRLHVGTEPLNFMNHLLVVHLKEESIIEQNTLCDNAPVSSDYDPSVNSSFNYNSDDDQLLCLNDDPMFPLRNNRFSRRNQPKRNIPIVKIFTAFIIGLTMGIILIFFFIKKQQSPSVAVEESIIPIGGTTVAVSQQTITTDKLPTIVCSHRRFNIIADILYSFDCSNATDDILGTFNGIPAIPSWVLPDSDAMRSMLPAYVTPDYSGQGAALKLDSSKKYQYIELIRSPIFFNQSFTISVWLNPNVQTSIDYCLLYQMYSTAPALVISIVDSRVVMQVYNSFIKSNTSLRNNQWQHVTFAFDQEDLSMAIRIDGILAAEGSILRPQYGNFQIQRTTIGSCDIYNQYNGLMDQLTIVFRIKNHVDVLDEATLVAHYNFEGKDTEDDLFKDTTGNNIQAQGSHVSHVIGSRRPDYNTLSLNDPALSYFQTGGFVLLSTHHYSYSYALWLHVSTVSSFMPLVHLVGRSELSSFESNSSNCLAVLAVNRTDTNHFQLSVYIYGASNPIIITSSMLVAYSTWFHVVVMSGINSFSLYVNGILAASATNIDTNTFKVNNQLRLTLTIGNPERGGILYASMCNIGTSETRSNESVTGVDDLRFYSRELKVKEIQALVNDDHSPTLYFFE